MGYLHEGHLSLLRRAREECASVVLSIFVNPLQFAPAEDFARYPRDEERDLDLAREIGVEAVFLPSAEEMYPGGSTTEVRVRASKIYWREPPGRDTSQGWRRSSPSS